MGTRLAAMLSDSGYEVSLLGRKLHESNGIKMFRWDVGKGEIDEKALEGQDIVINLAGANVASRRWTPVFREEIYNSRIQSTRLLFETIRQHNFPVKKYLAASATGIYANSPSPVDENGATGTDFLARVCLDWESAAAAFATIGIPVVCLRLGIVLSSQGGFVRQMAAPVRLGVGAALGSGRQHISWIHIDDLCRAFQFCIENDACNGVVNAVAPYSVTNEEMTAYMAKILRRPFFLPAIPAVALRLLFGAFAAELLADHNVLPQKLTESGFSFTYPQVEDALKDLLKDG